MVDEAAQAAQRVCKREDEWVEIPADLGDGFGPAPAIQLRGGAADGEINIRFEPGTVGRNVRITDLCAGIDLIEESA